MEKVIGLLTNTNSSNLTNSIINSNNLQNSLSYNNINTIMKNKNKNQPIVYKTNNLDNILDDIQKRREILNALLIIYQKRIKIQQGYSQDLEKLARSVKLSTLNTIPRSLINCSKIQEGNNGNNNGQNKEKQSSFNSNILQKPSFIILKRLLQQISSQAQISHNFSKKMSTQILQKLHLFIQTNQSGIKKLQVKSKQIQKTIITKQNKFKEVEQKFSKKANDLMKVKIKYISLLVNPQLDFYNTNKQYLNAKDLQKKFDDIQQQYQKNYKKVNEMIQTTQRRQGNVIQELSIKQNLKIQLMRQSFLSYSKGNTQRGAKLVHNCQNGILQIDTILIEMKQFIAGQKNYIQGEINNRKKRYLNPARYINNLFQKIEKRAEKNGYDDLIPSEQEIQKNLHYKIRDLLRQKEEQIDERDRIDISKPIKKQQEIQKQIENQNQNQKQKQKQQSNNSKNDQNKDEQQQFHKSYVDSDQQSDQSPKKSSQNKIQALDQSPLKSESKHEQEQEQEQEDKNENENKSEQLRKQKQKLSIKQQNQKNMPQMRFQFQNQVQSTVTSSMKKKQFSQQINISSQQNQEQNSFKINGKLVDYLSKSSHQKNTKKQITKQEIQRTYSQSQPFMLKKLSQETQQQTIIKIVKIFKHIFDNDIQAKQQTLNEFEKMMNLSSMIRKYFILCLQHFRINNNNQIKHNKLEFIARALNIFLCICKKECDTFNSKKLIVLLVSYYVQDQNRKLFLQEFIKKHSIWIDIGWWQAALLQSIYQQTKIKGKKNQHHIMSIWDVKGYGLKNQNDDQQLTFNNKVKSQLDFYVQNMSMFGFQDEDIVKFATKYIKVFGLPQKFSEQLMMFTENLHKSTFIFNEQNMQNGNQSSPLKILRKIRNHLASSANNNS